MDIPKTSKAMVLTRFSQPLELLDIPVPELKDGDMLVKVDLASVCGTDVHLARDELSMHPPTPIIMGHETVGEIYYLPDSVKTDVAGTPVKAGDRIMWSHFFDGTCYSCKVLHEPVLCEHSRGYGFSNAYELRGGYAEYEVVLSGTDFVRVPDNVTSEEAVGACCAGRTVVNAFDKLYNCGGIRQGDSVVVTGVGPVGLYAIVMAAQSGASRVIAVDISENRLEFAKKWGATHVVNAKDHPDEAERVKYIRGLCGGRGADVIIECSGVLSVFAENFKILANPSKYLIIGQTSDKSVPIVPNDIQHHNAVVIGSHSGDIRHYIKCLKFIEAHKDKYPFGEIISKKYPLAEANVALADMRSGVALKAALVNG
ncbi:D-arabinose 1-dehydrogenase, Zn-dependent alcohol dehydrogenase family [Sporobacter termitidis DSM 10068]|uniref:D-arabinose 1-dehydrogenase, Zn-dependent alcohol dehydrogenase family n=1 Tax=Sporobacter termitidis DSM 10068 TaxID=1123282 RepID=A0A1M5YM64_9FIRM|nr:zinc-binding dehydrogenase [Sporobacter termitidis]SHI12643.1 D-arabinose 1-dehydrogenase, Zn-dependent alcohol dehydrogenase family [Sporobacter termitidis DSM 10068]